MLGAAVQTQLHACEQQVRCGALEHLKVPVSLSCLQTEAPESKVHTSRGPSRACLRCESGHFVKHVHRVF